VPFERLYSWRVATATDTLTTGATQPTFNTSGLNTGSGSFFLSGGAGAVILTFSPVPEPGHILLLAAAAALAWRRRQFLAAHRRGW